MFRVLLPVDSNEDRALTAAETVTTVPESMNDIRVSILNVQEKIDVSDGEGHAKSEDWYNEADFPPSVDQVREYLEDTGADIEIRREHADPAEAIINVAEEIEADRIIMSGRKRSPTGKVLFGSVSQSVLLNSNIPVTFIRE